MLHEGRLTEQDLRGVREDKLDAIRSYADFLAKVNVDEGKGFGSDWPVQWKCMRSK
jgi:hypothetical protein